MPAHYGNNGQLSRDERVQLFGIDCEDKIIWYDWTPGVESVNDLVLQNVSLVTQQVKYQIPPTPEFDMPYPEPFKLAPGMTKSIPISFRPSRYEQHCDKIQILTKGGGFWVTVIATVKNIALSVQDFLNFDLCPLAEKTETYIDVFNSGTLKAAVRWHARPPFSVRCPSTTIDVGQMLRCTVAFEPKSASVYDALVVCEASEARDASSAASVTDDGIPNTSAPKPQFYEVRATGVGKMPHLCILGVPTPEVSFGDVFPGMRTPSTLVISNTTPVRATFKVRPLQDPSEVTPLPPNSFSVVPESGVVEPMSNFPLTFYFYSHTVKEHACQRFQITTPGGTPLLITCKAYSKPIEVRLSTRSINFGEIPVGKPYSRTLQIHNDSDRPAQYHFINVGRTGIFYFDRPQGVVPANSFMVVTVFFGPLTPINCHKQVSCVVKGALTPLTLHLLGSSHTEKVRPARLDQKHIDLFKNMRMCGINEHPEPANKEQNMGQDEEDEDEDDAHTDTGPSVPVKAHSASQTFLEMMLPMDSKLRDIALSRADIDFGSCSSHASSDKEDVTMSNRTNSKVAVVWMLPGQGRLASAPDERAILSVYPTTCDIPPRGQQSFTVTFRPRTENSFEGDALEAIVYRKDHRNFRLVDLKRFTPPWVVGITGMGHTMGSTRNDPRLDIAESHIRFRACAPGERSYQIAMFTNPGDTPIAYRVLTPVDAGGPADGDLEDVPEDVPFRAWPMQGVIPPHQFHLMALEFAPTRARNETPYVANFNIIVDYNDKEGRHKTLHVTGRAWEPKVTFCRGQSMVTFPPTCSGIASSMACMIKNVSEIPIAYECRIPSRFRSVFWFTSPVGELEPSESSSIEAHFRPTGEKVFSAPLYCLARCVTNSDSAVEGPVKALMPTVTDEEPANPTYVLQFIGHGKGPVLSLEPNSLDLGAVKACDEKTYQLTVVNSSNLTVHYSVSFEFVSEEEAGGELTHEVGSNALQLGRSEGSVSGRCTETLEIMFRPPVRGLYQYQIIVTPKGDHGPEGHAITLPLQADVQYPCIQIADLRTEAATLQPQSMMWTQFEVDGINTLYRGEVSKVERRFQAAIGIDVKKKLITQLKPFQLLFGTSAAGSRPTVVYLTLSNPSRLKIQFSFNTPKDLNLESAPYWCDEKALVDDREAHFSWVEEHNIYDIEPRSGSIEPGDYLHVKMTYHQHSIGTHILPVVFNVHDGRSILMYLKAHSVAPNVGCLSVRSSVISLQPVPLNVERGTTQPVELTNSGCIPAPWRIDLQSIFAFNMDNYDYEILSVTPVEGVLQPQSSTFLHFTFTPLEAKGYVCPVRIEMLKDGRAAEELLFELRADAYDPESEKPTTDQLFPANLPIITKTPIPNYGASLSIEILDFGNCPIRAMASRMLILVNYSKEFVLTYKWEPRQLFRPGELTIEPSSGELSPGSHKIIVFGICCSLPADVSGEVPCLLDWTHISAYGQEMVVCEDNRVTKPEYMAFQSDHIHEPMRSGKAFIAGEHSKHVSVANRLTVSRFRNLMSTAAGQKFLNENLHRTALLASHIPTMSPRDVLRANNKQRGLGGTGPLEGARIPPFPSCNPLYVRVRVCVADWDVSKEARQDFLVLDPRLAPDLDKEALDDSFDMLQSQSSIRGGTKNDAACFAASGLELDATNKSVQDKSIQELRDTQPEPTGTVGPDTVVGVLEHMIREVIAEEDFGAVLDKMLTDQMPYFVQYEDSPPPGEPPAPESAMVAETLQLLEEACDFPSGPDFPDLEAADDGLFPWRSDLLLDFEAPDLLFTGAGNGGGRSTRQAPVPLERSQSASAAGGEATSNQQPAATASPSSALGTDDAGGFEDSPQGFWEDALNQYGEVDLETFRRDAGEALEHMLLDMVDDVISGKLNWTRPLPRAKPRR